MDIEKRLSDYHMGDLSYKYIKLKEIVEWENHIVGLLKDENFIKNIIRKDIFSKIGITDKHEIEDLILFILITLYLEIPYTFELFDKGHHSKKFKQKVDNIRKEIIQKSKEINKEIYKFRIFMRDNYQDQYPKNHIKKTNKHIDDLIDSSISNSNSIIELLDHPIDIIYNVSDSWSYFGIQFQTRKLKSKTGIRDLSLKYMTLVFQIYFVELPKNYQNVLFTLLENIVPYDQLHCFSYEDVSKYISKQIKDYKQDKKRFINEFLGFKRHIPYIPKDENDLQAYSELNHKNTRINKYIMKWIENQNSFISYLLFRLDITNGLSRIKNLLPEDLEKI